MKALGKRDFERAGEHFTHSSAGFPEERDSSSGHAIQDPV